MPRRKTNDTHKTNKRVKFLSKRQNHKKIKVALIINVSL